MSIIAPIVCRRRCYAIVLYELVPLPSFPFISLEKRLLGALDQNFLLVDLREFFSDLRSGDESWSFSELFFKYPQDKQLN